MTPELASNTDTKPDAVQSSRRISCDHIVERIERPRKQTIADDPSRREWRARDVAETVRCGGETFQETFRDVLRAPSR